MSNQDYTKTFSVDQTPKEAFDAINNVRGWWGGDIKGSTDNLGGEFTYRYEDFHRSKQKIIEFIPKKKVVWLVLEGGPKFAKDQIERKETRNMFEIFKRGDKRQIRFAHHGRVRTL